MISFENADIWQDDKLVLAKVNFRLALGETCYIIGKSGSGKTTLMNMIGFLDRLTTGTYSFLGEDVSLLNENKKSSQYKIKYLT